jgi:predicted methyltransferase
MAVKMNFMSIVAFVHDAVSSIVQEGDHVVDATTGNGNDTLFLAGLVGKDGHVTGFDIQDLAVSETSRRISEAGMDARVELHRVSHERMDEYVSEPVRCAMFNLGYLPGGDKTISTTADSTLAALGNAIELLLPGGLVTVVLYRDHEGGGAEAESVLEKLSQLGPGYTVCRYQVMNTVRQCPEAILVYRKK